MSKIILILLILLIAGSVTADKPLRHYQWVFHQAPIQFDPDSAMLKSTSDKQVLDNGRELSYTINIPEQKNKRIVTGYFEINPIPKNQLSVSDPWDRAGNIRLAVEGQPDIELIKFITSYGGKTSYEVDLTPFDYLLTGDITFKAFIDTWVSPGWNIDFKLRFESADSSVDLSKHAPDWINSLVYIPSYHKTEQSKNGYEIEVDIPAGMKRVFLNYLVSGHCTDGRDADEFISKDNVIYVDDVVVYRFQPWRDDCREFREINPYTKRWSDGYWSSDYNRSGWCPGDLVKPLVLDLSDHLKPGKHKVRFQIENIRPKDENGHFGYWRVSSYLTGWETMDVFKYNEE